MKRQIINSFCKFFLPLIILCGCTPSSYFIKQNENSILLISGNHNNLSMPAISITLYLKNVNTNEIIISKTFGTHYKYAIISNLAPGEYVVDRIDVIFENKMIFNKTEELKQFFGLIKIEPNSKYFLGNYSCYQTSLINKTTYFQIINHNIPEKAKAKIENLKYGWGNSDFIKLEPINYKVLFYY